MSMFRAKKLDLGCFVNIKVIRDHTKRKVYEKHETERCVCYLAWLLSMRCSRRTSALQTPLALFLEAEEEKLHTS